MTKLKTMKDLAPESVKAFWEFDTLAVAGLSLVKYKELIAVPVALTTQCPYSIGINNDDARTAAKNREMAQAAMVTASIHN